MEPNDQFQTELSSLSKPEKRLILWVIRVRRLRLAIKHLSPRQMIPTVALSEATVIALSVYAHDALIAAVGTFVTVAIGMFPMLLQPAPDQAHVHWVKAPKP